MQKYFYRAVDINKKKYKGYLFAENTDELKILLSEQKLFLISAKPVSNKPPSAFFSLTGRVSVKELAAFCRQFAIMIDSGISIIDSLDLLYRQTYSGYFKKVIFNVFEDVKVGKSLSEAMAKHKKVFPDFFTSMTYVGEQSGMLDEILRTVADYYENEAKIKQRTESAMIYPIFLAILMALVAVFMVAFVIPAFEEAFSQLDVEMPALTAAIIDISHWFLDNWVYIVLAALTLVIILIVLEKTKRGRYFYDTLKIKLPLIAKVQTALVTARFARGFGILLSSGMELMDAMRVISPVLGNKNVERRFMLAVRDVEEGKSFTSALSIHKLFPTMLIRMAAVGENTGSVDKVLLDSSSYFDAQAYYTLTSIVNMIQPVMLVIMGAAVGVLFYAVYSPMLSMMESM